MDAAAHEFSSASLGMLEYLTRRVAAVPRGGAKATDDSGLLDRASFGVVLAGCARDANHAGLSLGLAMLETADVPGDGSLSPLFTNLPAPRLTTGFVDRHHVAVFAVAESLDLVRERLARIRREIGSRLAVRATAELTYEDPVPCMEGEAFITRAQEVLARAIAIPAAGHPPFLALDSRRR
jgi:hypothetical protein